MPLRVGISRRRLFGRNSRVVRVIVQRTWRAGKQPRTAEDAAGLVRGVVGRSGTEDVDVPCAAGAARRGRCWSAAPGADGFAPVDGGGRRSPGTSPPALPVGATDRSLRGEAVVAVTAR